MKFFVRFSLQDSRFRTRVKQMGFMEEKKVKFRGGALQHYSLIGLLYSDPKGVPSFISTGAAHKRRERPQLAKEGTIDGIS
jgi:hypothetical protein